MQSAFSGADTVETCLKTPQKAAAALRRYDKAMRRGPSVFSWFIYRVTTPSLRNLFMHPSNHFRLQEALLSVLAGDIFRNTPIHMRLLLFKTIYYLTSAANLKRSWAAWRQRKRAITDPGMGANTA